MEYKYPSKEILEANSKEIANEEKYYNLSEMLDEKEANLKLSIPVGKDADNEFIFMDLKKVSGFLITGETGSGKSVYLNSIIISLLLKNSPEELQFLFMDPTKVEFSKYFNLSHNLLSSSKTDYIKVQLKTLCDELKKRKELFKKSSVKTIDDYNEKNDKKLPHMIYIINEIKQAFNSETFNNYMLTILEDGYKYGIHIILGTSSYLNDSFDKKVLDSFKYIMSFDLADKKIAKFISLKGADLLSVCGDALIRKKKDTPYNIQTPYVSEKDINNIINEVNKNI